MIDFSGLLVPEVANQLSETFLYSDSAIWVAETYEPAYFVVPEGHYEYWEQEYGVEHCTLLKIFHGKDYDLENGMLVFGCE